MDLAEPWYHVSVLSNFARAFDKYTGTYSKTLIPESSFPGRFFLLKREELHIGIDKAGRLLSRLQIPGNRLIVLETVLPPSRLKANTRTGLGQYIDGDHIEVRRVHALRDGEEGCCELDAMALEDVMAQSLALNGARFHSFKDLVPRTVSILPVAQACQAKCAFCFSRASVSSDQAAAAPTWSNIQDWLALARECGAERAVITGGGEPTLLKPEDLLRLIQLCRAHFQKVVLITNGHLLTRQDEPATQAHLQRLHQAGLGVLAVSRHHFDDAANAGIMGLAIPFERIAHAWRSGHDQWPDLRLRLICVLQKGGIDSAEKLLAYLDWSSRLGIEEICFKELYVSTSSESVYFDRQANAWSRSHQVPLSLVTSTLMSHGFVVDSRLPWGAPVFKGNWQGRVLKVAAYTEPSLFWERTHGVARSWNVMADGQCHVSLEDRDSRIEIGQLG